MKTASGEAWFRMESVPCPNCEKDSTDLVYETKDWLYGNEGVFHLVRCRVCSLVYLNPRPVPEEAWKFYPKQYFAYQPFNSRKPAHSRLRKLRLKLKEAALVERLGYPAFSTSKNSFFPLLRRTVVWPLLTFLSKRRLEFSGIPPYYSRHRILDVGCGSGSFVREMEQLGWEAYGLELNPEAVRYARDHMDLKVSEGSLPSLKLEAGFFDVVTMFDSFEHMPNPREVLDDVHRILAPGGLLIMNTPNFNSFYRKVFGDRWFNVAAPLHYYLYAKEPLKALLLRSGLLVQKILYPLGEAGLEQTFRVLLTGSLDGNKSSLDRLLRSVVKIPHRLSPGGHLLVYAGRPQDPLS